LNYSHLHEIPNRFDDQTIWKLQRLIDTIHFDRLRHTVHILTDTLRKSIEIHADGVQLSKLISHGRPKTAEPDIR
jgi:hypothetical protein